MRPLLSTSIRNCLGAGQVTDEFKDALLSSDRIKTNVRTEDTLWDYKEALPLNTDVQIAEFAKDVAAFHNRDGGVLIVGVCNQYSVKGVDSRDIIDVKRLRDKLRKYLGDQACIFQDSIALPNKRYVWLVFVRKNRGCPQEMQQHGPDAGRGKRLFMKGDIFYREGDETKRCQSESDFRRVFNGFAGQNLLAYNYEVDELYFRLLSPNYDRFIGRRSNIDELRAELAGRYPVICLDGIGGVGKTSIAIETLREIFASDEKPMFIASISSKAAVWTGFADSRRPTFSGFRVFLRELADVFGSDVSQGENIEDLKNSLCNLMHGTNGIIFVDNLENIHDHEILKFLSHDVPDFVKVLITSRVDKRIGGRILSVPAMTREEAQALFNAELARLQVEPMRDDAEYVEQILEKAGGVPLAIKWAAQIAGDESLRRASQVLRTATGGKKEFLGFCFASMYETLSDDAKSVCSLLPYFKKEWSANTLSVALNLPPETVENAIFEASEKGLLFHSSMPPRERYDALPLTKDFLWDRFQENVALRKRVENNIAEMLVSKRGGEAVFDIPASRRVEVLRANAFDRRKVRDYPGALKLIKLAQDYSPDPILRFEEGQVRAEMGQAPAALQHVRRALQDRAFRISLTVEQQLFAAELFFVWGGPSSERDAIELLSEGDGIVDDVNGPLLERFIRAATVRRRFEALIRFFRRTGTRAAVAIVTVPLRELIEDAQFVQADPSGLTAWLQRTRGLVGTTKMVAEIDGWLARIEKLSTHRRITQ